MFFVWLFFNIVNVMAWMVMYSLYLELTGISQLEDMAKLKMDTMSSRAGSIYGSRPTSPYGGGTLTRAGVGKTNTLQSQPSNASSYGYATSAATSIPMNNQQTFSQHLSQPPKRQSHF